MFDNMSRAKHIWIRIVMSLIAIGAVFGYRCPMEGCPACKLLGK
jgi:hypothetical protein